LGGTSAEIFDRFRWPTFELPPRAIELAESVIGRADIRICYVVATWGGIRRIPNVGHDADPSYYVAHHLRWLARFASPFVQRVVVAAPWLPKEPQDGSSEYHAALERAVEGCEIEAVLFRRPNVGMSYGSFSDVWRATKDDGFTHWIFNEDDYVYPVGSFDHILVGKLLSDPELGYVGGYIRRNHTREHAGICSGIASAEDLAALAADSGSGVLPHDNRPEMGSDYPANQWGQVHWTNRYHAIGKKLADLVPDGLSCGYIRPRAKMTWYDPPDGLRRPFIAPIQAFEPEEWGLGWAGPKDAAEEYQAEKKPGRYEQKRARWRG